MSNRSLNYVAKLSEYRWTIPLLAALKRRDGARFIELLNSVGLSRDSLARTLDHMIAMNWVKRNTGHGHPLRPEYLLTTRGRKTAQIALGISDAQRHLGLSETGMARWSLPVIYLMGKEASRFRDIRYALPEISPRALSQSLKSLLANDLISREVTDGFPPATLYLLTEKGTTLFRAMPH